MGHVRGKRRGYVLAVDRLEERVVMSAFSTTARLISNAGVGTAPPTPGSFLTATTTTPRNLAGLIGRLPNAPSSTVSTVPANGDQNPYGVAKVPRGFLVTNFNSSSNLQGTGTTLQKLSLNGTTKTFYKAPMGFALTGAIGVLSKGFVFVGNVPTSNGTAATIKPGSLLVLNRYGQAIANLKNSKLLDGPWGMTVHDRGNTAQVFVSNVLNGTVTRLDVTIRDGAPDITKATTVASGYTTQASASALVLGPTGLAFDAKTNVLYVASTADNAIYAVAGAGGEQDCTHSDPRCGAGQAMPGKGTLLVQNDGNLQGPIGLAFTPDGNLLVTNGDAVDANPSRPSLLLEYTTAGKYVNSISLDPNQGAAFGLAIKTVGNEYWLATVNDATNTLDIRKATRCSPADPSGC